MKYWTELALPLFSMYDLFLSCVLTIVLTETKLNIISMHVVERKPNLLVANVLSTINLPIIVAIEYS